jgi:putative oxidoreductase
MRPGKLHAQLASGTEMVTGVMLAIGLLTPFAAAGIIGVMVVAGWTVHRDKGFFIVGEGWEYTFVVGLMALVIAGLGPGRWSIDWALGIVDDLNGWTGLAIAAVLGIGGGIAQLAVFFRPPAPKQA